MNRVLAVVIGAGLLACDSREAKLEHGATLEFGNVALGESSRLELELTNTGKQAAELTFSVDTSDFTLDELGRTLKAGESMTLIVRFAPTALGPRAGTINLGASTVALLGRGLGPQLSAPGQVTLGPATIITGQPIEPLVSSVTLRNTGTSGSVLRLGTPRVDGTELCVGTFNGTTCEPWQPPALLDTATLLEVPLSLLPNGDGVKTWTVIFPSNDRVNPEIRVEVRALVEAFAPCVFEAPANFSLLDLAVLTLRHVGPGTCQVRSAMVSPDLLLHLTAPQFPLRLASNETLELGVALRAGATGTFPAFIRVTAAGTAPFEVHFQRVAPLRNCLSVTPSRLEFEDRNLHCSALQTAVVSNTCADPAVIDFLVIGEAAGEPPSGPNCPGTAPCPEFTISTGIPSGTVISPGSRYSFAINYRPLNYGVDTGSVVIAERGGVEVVVPLVASGDSARISDTFHRAPLPMIDVLVMVDSSPSFVPRRTSVRSNLRSLLNWLGDGCRDARFAIAAADGDPDAGVQLQLNDAGSGWTSSSDPSFAERSLSAFDTLPVGSEDEACIGPAANLIDDAGVRDGGAFSGICVTDALEGSLDSIAALARLRSHVPSASKLTWSAIASYGGSSCGAEALDDGVHWSLVQTTLGIREDVCSPAWGQSFNGLGILCQPRNRLYLSTRPAGPLEVRVDGVLVPQTSWTYDAMINAVIFDAPVGSTTTITYEQAVCPP